MSPPERPIGKPIVLIGMMGAGKSTIGQRLAEAMGRDFVDCDQRIAAEAGKSIADIFEADGEAAFRALEKEVMGALLSGKNSVIAAGGGAFMDKTLRASIQSKAVSVWLKANPEEMYLRAIADNSRPLLRSENPHKVFMDLYHERQETYALADITIDCEKASPGAVVQFILAALEGID